MAPKRKFVVQMYETEYRQIQAWVAKHQHIETGGDLFGLWADEHTAVVQLVLGPGKNCRRSAVSFYQDIDYLERVGNVLTSKEGLCHIGEWHSHHRIGLTRPSGGDENTVWTNMDRYGIHRFFLFIATIGSSTYDVNIGCFLFEINPNTKRQQPVLRGDIKPFAENEESPFRNSVQQCLTYGSESLNTSQWLNRFNSNTFTGKRSFNFLEEDQNGKRPKKNDQEKEAYYTTQIVSNDQNLTGESELKNQEDKRESIPVKDRGKPNIYEEEESKGNETGCIPFKEDNKDHEKQKPDLEEDPKKPENQESQVVRLTTGLSNDSDRENRYTVKIQVTEDDNQDVEPEIDTTMDAENSKISQEIENQSIERGTFSFPTAGLGKRQLNPTEKNDKSENLKNLSSVTAKETEDKDALTPKNAKKPKVEYLGYEEGSKGRQDALHDKVSGDVEATTVTNSQVIEVKPANEDSKPNQSQTPNTLDRNERTLKEHSSKVYAEDELKDAQLNERKQQSTVCGEIEEVKSENEIKPLVQDEESVTEGEKSRSKFLCFPIERKAFNDKEKEKKTEKKGEKNEKQKEKKRKKEEKKKQKKEEKEKKQQKKEQKKEKKKQKKEQKKEKKKQKKEQKKEEGKERH